MTDTPCSPAASSSSPFSSKLLFFMSEINSPLSSPHSASSSPVNHVLNATMDSLALASTVQGVKEQCFQLLFMLSELIPGHPTTNPRTFGLHYELRILFSALRNAWDVLYHHDTAEFALVHSHLWRQILASFTCLKSTLGELAGLIRQIQQAGAGIETHGTAVAALRDKLFMSNCALEIIACIMVVSIQVTHGRKDSFVADLDALKATIYVAYHASSRPIGGFSIDTPDFSMQHEMLCLIHEAWHFYSSVAHVSNSQPPTTLTHNQPVTLVPAFLPDLEPENFPSSPWVEDADYERFLRRYPRAVLESAAVDIHNGKYSHAIKSIYHLWRAQPKPGRLLMFPECRLLCAQLAVCYFLQGNTDLAEYHVMALVDSMANQDLISCTLLHALTLAHLFEGRLSDAKSACGTTVMWKRAMCMICRINRVEWHEYRESIALRATIFEFDEDYGQAEVYWKMLPQSFSYSHPSSIVQYLNSKSDVFGPLIGCKPRETVETTVPGRALVEDPHGFTIGHDGSHSLRQRVLEYKQAEIAVTNELLSCRSDENLSANTADVYIRSPFMARGGFRNAFQPLTQSMQMFPPEPSLIYASSDDDSDDDELPAPSGTELQTFNPSTFHDVTQSMVRMLADRLHVDHTMLRDGLAELASRTHQLNHSEESHPTNDDITKTEEAPGAQLTLGMTSSSPHITPRELLPTPDRGSTFQTQTIPTTLRAEDPGSVSNNTPHKISTVLPSLRPMKLCQNTITRQTLERTPLRD